MVASAGGEPLSEDVEAVQTPFRGGGQVGLDNGEVGHAGLAYGAGVSINGTAADLA